MPPLQTAMSSHQSWLQIVPQSHRLLMIVVQLRVHHPLPSKTLPKTPPPTQQPPLGSLMALLPPILTLSAPRLLPAHKPVATFQPPRIPCQVRMTLIAAESLSPRSSARCHRSHCWMSWSQSCWLVSCLRVKVEVRGKGAHLSMDSLQTKTAAWRSLRSVCNTSMHSRRKLFRGKLLFHQLQLMHWCQLLDESMSLVLPRVADDILGYFHHII